MRIVLAHAKVNLALEVVGRRTDGFHDLDSLVAPIDWHDLIGFEFVPDRPGAVDVRVSGPEASALPAGAQNLAAEAAVRLMALTPKPAPGIEVWLDKRIPIEAGLGGGSSDAAAVLRAGVKALRDRDVDVAAPAVMTIAQEIGSDVPALIEPRTVRVRGRGDGVTPITLPRLHLAIAVAGRVSTAQAFAAVTAPAANGRVDRILAATSVGQPVPDDECGSDLERPARAVSSELGANLDRLRARTPAKRWHMTGSGGAAFALADDGAEAAQLAQVARDAGFTARPCHTVG